MSLTAVFYHIVTPQLLLQEGHKCDGSHKLHLQPADNILTQMKTDCVAVFENALVICRNHS
jgi:hypothetical protein